MQLTKPRILYAEDHTDTRELVSLLLCRSNYEVIGTESGTMALTRAQQEHFDLYLFDTQLPDVSGLDLCHKIREFDASTPVLFFSASAHEDDRHRALSSGAQGYLTKPEGLIKLAETISHLIGASQPVSS